MKNRLPSLGIKAPRRHGRVLFLLLQLCTISGLGQDIDQVLPNYNLVYSIPDSLENRLKLIKSKAQKVRFLIEQVEKSFEQNIPLALYLAEEASNLLKGSNESLLRAQVRFWKGKLLSWKDPESAQLQIALVEARNALQEFERVQDNLWIAKSHNLIALIYFYQFQYSQAMKEIDRTFALEKKQNPNSLAWREVKSEALRIKGNILLYQNPTIDSTLALYRESQAFYVEIRDSIKLATLLLNQAIALAGVDSLKSSSGHPDPRSFYLSAIDIYKRKAGTEDLSIAYLEYGTYLADIFLKSQTRSDFLQSNSYLDSGLVLAPIRSCELYCQLGMNYQNMAAWNLDTSLSRKMILDTAAVLYQKTMERAIKEQNVVYFKLATEKLRQICPILKNARCRESIGSINKNYQKILGEISQVKDTVLAKNMAYQDELSIRKQRQILTWTSGSAIGILATISFIYYRSRLKNLNKALENKMEALRAQMNPHFISNSLNAIDSLINQNRNDEASDYIIDFSRLCRLVLNHSKEKRITLEEEIETLKYFITLEKLRLGDNLTYSIDVDDELNQSDIQIPPMLLQPFVENAIWHGIQKKQAPGHLEVAVFKNDLGQLECQITDDGIGRKKAQELQEESVLERQSWGMQITKERMEAVKKIEGSVLEITDLKPNDLMPGTKVSIKFPLLPFKPEKL